MKNKKGIVLFVTLLFIIALSVLIVKNLAITDEFINVSAKNANIKQLEISIKNINEQVVGMFQTKKVTTLHEDIIFPFSYGNVDVDISLTEYDNTNRYKLDENLTTVPQNINGSVLLEIVKGKQITNQRQVDYVIDEYINKTNDYRILEVAEQFTYYPNLTQNNNSNNISCRYDVDIDGLKANVFFVFSLSDYNITVKPTIIIKR